MSTPPLARKRRPPYVGPDERPAPPSGAPPRPVRDRRDRGRTGARGGRAEAAGRHPDRDRHAPRGPRERVRVRARDDALPRRLRAREPEVRLRDRLRAVDRALDRLDVHRAVPDRARRRRARPRGSRREDERRGGGPRRGSRDARGDPAEARLRDRRHHRERVDRGLSRFRARLRELPDARLRERRRRESRGVRGRRAARRSSSTSTTWTRTIPTIRRSPTSSRAP